MDRADRVRQPAARPLGRPAGRRRAGAAAEAGADLAFAPRGKVAAELVAQDIPEIEVKARRGGRRRSRRAPSAGRREDGPTKAKAPEEGLRLLRGRRRSAGARGLVALAALATPSERTRRNEDARGGSRRARRCCRRGRADAFCGFYVERRGAKLFNNATQVVLMREGTRTVLSMQNNYQGPPEDFAMVVPVPVVLRRRTSRRCRKEVFDRVDALGAPRLVEYWEQDPCAPRAERRRRWRGGAAAARRRPAAAKARSGGVKIEAQFDVGEYQIVILSAKDSTGLDTWLRDEKYKIPDGRRAAPAAVRRGRLEVLRRQGRPREGEVRRTGARCCRRCASTTTADEFNLPIRLGLINSPGTRT